MNETLTNGIKLGIKLHQFRIAKRLTLKDVSRSASCSESMLSKIENDKVTPSIGLLHRLVSVLGTNMNTLFEQIPVGVVTRKGKRPALSKAENGDSEGISLELLTPFPSPILFQSTIHTIPPRCRSDGSIVHEGEDFGYILQGTLQLSVGDELYTLHVGDTFYFSSELPHGYYNPGDEVTRVLWFNTPATF